MDDEENFPNSKFALQFDLDPFKGNYNLPSMLRKLRRLPPPEVHAAMHCEVFSSACKRASQHVSEHLDQLDRAAGRANAALLPSTVQDVAATAELMGLLLQHANLPKVLAVLRTYVQSSTIPYVASESLWMRVGYAAAASEMLAYAGSPDGRRVYSCSGAGRWAAENFNTVTALHHLALIAGTHAPQSASLVAMAYVHTGSSCISELLRLVACPYVALAVKKAALGALMHNNKFFGPATGMQHVLVSTGVAPLLLDSSAFVRNDAACLVTGIHGHVDAAATLAVCFDSQDREAGPSVWGVRLMDPVAFTGASHYPGDASLAVLTCAADALLAQRAYRGSIGDGRVLFSALAAAMLAAEPSALRAALASRPHVIRALASFALQVLPNLDKGVADNVLKEIVIAFHVVQKRDPQHMASCGSPSLWRVGVWALRAAYRQHAHHAAALTHRDMAPARRAMQLLLFLAEHRPPSLGIPAGLSSHDTAAARRIFTRIAQGNSSWPPDARRDARELLACALFRLE